jgi:hypothetical protein
MIDDTIAATATRVEAEIATFVCKPGPMRWEDMEDDNDYYVPAATIGDLFNIIQDCTNHQCVEMLRYLGWDSIRLIIRERLPNGKLTNAPTAKTFVKELIDYHLHIAHPVCKLLDQAAFMVLYKRSAVYIHRNTLAVTGRAVEASESLEKDKHIGPIEFDNPLNLIKNLTCDQLSYAAKELIINPTNRKTLNISRLAKLWKGAEDDNNLRLKQRIYDVIGNILQFMTIQSPVSTHFRAVSTQVLYLTKGSS